MRFITHTLGFPRIGIERELKKLVEGFWKGSLSSEELEKGACELRHRHWQVQQEMGIELLPVGDFSLYDHILDVVAMLGAVPPRYGANEADLMTYFRMARGDAGKGGAKAMEMTKWFDTNYHYIVPEFHAGQILRPSADRLLAHLDEAAQSGLMSKAVLPGPITFLYLGKSMEPGFDRFNNMQAVVEAYAEIVIRIAGKCEWVQLDEPILALDLERRVLDYFKPAYEHLSIASGKTRLMLATYFGSVEHNARTIEKLPIQALHLDLVRAPGQLDAFLGCLGESVSLSLGLINGRNIWITDLEKALGSVSRAADALGPERVMLAPSCSLLHVPIDIEAEGSLNSRIKSWMAFAKQKCGEVRLLAKGACNEVTTELFQSNRSALADRRAASLERGQVRECLPEISENMYRRSSPYEERVEKQRKSLALPFFPTTTIGSYPQTPEIRKLRSAFKSGEIGDEEYKKRINGFIKEVLDKQLELGLDVLVHGEPERNDMVEYFGEQLDGFAFTSNGWVQSYGSRCVKPPVIYGDVSRAEPMTMGWFHYAQSLTDKPVKGMLTGPVTILCWSFVRDDQHRSETCRQIALAILDEVRDLEKIGAKIIQIDEPALREGLPLRRGDWDEYLEWAVQAFRLATSSVRDETQIHTHMCYADFNEIIDWIARMDADVISIEASRSAMTLLEAFRDFHYPNEIGPGVYDIHSPRVPPVQEMVELLEKAAEHVDWKRLWVNPDCGLKTREWPETLEALANMVEAAKIMRKRMKS